jgi:hypothetical protein
MSTPSRAQLLLQLDTIHHNGQLAVLERVATTHGILPTALWIAINSRETNCVNELGDFQGGEHHGVGMCQIDIQHPIARQARDDGSWKTPEGFERLQEYGASILATNIASVRGYFDDVTDEDVYRIAADGYNEHMDRAEHDAEDGGDPDRLTTGHNYGADVVARMKIFADLLTVLPT